MNYVYNVSGFCYRQNKSFISESKGQMVIGLFIFLLLWLLFTGFFFVMFDYICDWLTSKGIYLWGFPRSEEYGGWSGWLHKVWDTINPMERLRILLLKVFYSAMFGLVPALILGGIIMLMFKPRGVIRRVYI